MTDIASQTRNGILAGGNFIIDHVKIIDDYPPQDTLASILSESSSNGGGPYNVLRDLRAMGASFPLSAAGLVGEDSDGAWILADCLEHDIDTTLLQQTGEAPTSYTDAMTVQATGRRTFFHQRGANALLNRYQFDFSRSNARLFHLGYLMLLDALDSFEEDGKTGAAHVLEAARAVGMITSVDLVSTHHPEFRQITASALAHVDYAIMNEIEAAKITGVDLQSGAETNSTALLEAARALFAEGVHRGVVIHCEAGAVAYLGDDGSKTQGSVALPPNWITGATGAGDAFAAGFLSGIHEGLPASDCLRDAVCVAAACLSRPTPSGGVLPLEKCREIGAQFGYRTFEP